MKLRVWHIPQVPGQAFQREVPDLETAGLLLRALADYDLFQFEHRIKPDYANAQGLEVYDPEGGWEEWMDAEEGEDISHHLRSGTDLSSLT